MISADQIGRRTAASAGSDSALADDAHGGGFAGLAQRVVPQDLGQLVHRGLFLGEAQDVGPQVVDVHNGHWMPQGGGQLPGGAVGIIGGKDHIVVIGRDGPLGGTVDAPGLGAGDDVEPAPLVEELTDHAAKGGKEDPQGTAC